VLRGWGFQAPSNIIEWRVKDYAVSAAAWTKSITLAGEI
jgi:hypothetical protein